MNGGRVDLLMILDDGTEDIGPRGVVTEVFFYSILELKRDRW